MAMHAPFFDRLDAPSQYVFQGINESAEEEEFYEESSKFFSIPLLLPIMRLERIADDSQLIATKRRDAMIAK